MQCFIKRKATVIAIGVCASLASVAPAIAGERNFLYIEQVSGAGGLGNTLFVDQSAATDSMVAGDTAGITPARQQGDGNEARITLTGGDGKVLLSQQNTSAGFLSSQMNQAAIHGGDLATILLHQEGFGNIGTIDVGPGGNTGALFQKGDRNDGAVIVTGSGNTGTLRQLGNDNTYELEVSGPAGTSVQWNQIGDGVSAAPFTPAQVYSNAGTITITQFAP